MKRSSRPALLLLTLSVIAASCTGSEQSDAPAADGDASTVAESEPEDANTGTDFSEPSTGEPVATDEPDVNNAAPGRPTAPPDGFPFDCGSAVVPLVHVAQFTDGRMAGVDSTGTVIWESNIVTEIDTDPVFPQTNEFYFGERRLLDLGQQTVVDEYDGDVRFRLPDCSAIYDGIDIPLQRVAPNGFVMWENDDPNRSSVEAITPSTVIVNMLEEENRAGYAALSLDTGEMLWSENSEADIRRTPTVDVVVFEGEDDADPDYRIVDAETGEPIFEFDGTHRTWPLCGSTLWWENREDTGPGTIGGIEWYDLTTGEVFDNDPDIRSITLYFRGDSPSGRSGTGAVVQRESGASIVPDCSDPSTEFFIDGLDLPGGSFTAVASDDTVGIGVRNGLAIVDPNTGELLFESEDLGAELVRAATGDAYILDIGDTIQFLDDRSGAVVGELADAEYARTLLAPPGVDTPILEVFTTEAPGLSRMNGATGELLTID